MVLDKVVLQNAVVGLLVEEGHDADGVLDDFKKYGLGPSAPDYIQKAMRKVASIALTFQAHGIIREQTH